MPTILTPSRPAAIAVEYRLRLATGARDLESAQRLRFEVFNLELNEGLDRAYLSGLDEDRFDEACDHLLVEHTQTGEVVGTYRLQTGWVAATRHGYYGAQEFDFCPYEAIRGELVELGRACIHRHHRQPGVLNLLWRGVITYTLERGARYCIGCSSLTTQDAGIGAATYEKLRPRHLVEEKFRTEPLADYQLPADDFNTACPNPPRLLRAYLALGAKICGPPALDREFRTIDFLTLVDLHTLSAAAHLHFFG